MLAIDYSHDVNRSLHTVEGATNALRTIFPEGVAGSVLDVGAGTGTWLRAAQELGAREVHGVDGLDLDQKMLFVEKSLILIRDLNKPYDAGRRFDLVMSFETAEHLEPENAEVFVDTLVKHGDTILFGAAAPRQPGTHHVNCQWPSYWQGLFNARGFLCDDWPRWRLWDRQDVEPWYRQNIMIARKDPAKAGSEPRIHSVIHPALLPNMAETYLDDHAELIASGAMRWPWYLKAPVRAVLAKARAKFPV